MLLERIWNFFDGKEESSEAFESRTQRPVLHDRFFEIKGTVKGEAGNGFPDCRVE
jgi:hypothetical protein